MPPPSKSELGYTIAGFLALAPLGYWVVRTLLALAG